MARTIEIGSTEFQVDMVQMKDAIATVAADTATIESDFHQIEARLRSISSVWISPAGETFEDLYPVLVQRGEAMVQLLHSMVDRMRTTYANYEQAEQTNAANLS